MPEQLVLQRRTQFARYEPASETIRHEPTNVCLIVLTHPRYPQGKPYVYALDPANEPYQQACTWAITQWDGRDPEELARLVSEQIAHIDGPTCCGWPSTFVLRGSDGIAYACRHCGRSIIVEGVPHA